MRISYKPLWKLLIDKEMKKKDLCQVAGISPASVTKMGKGGHVNRNLGENLPGVGLLCDRYRRACPRPEPSKGSRNHRGFYHGNDHVILKNANQTGEGNTKNWRSAKGGVSLCADTSPLSS